MAGPDTPTMSAVRAAKAIGPRCGWTRRRPGKRYRWCCSYTFRMRPTTRYGGTTSRWTRLPIRAPARLGELALKHSSYVAAGMYEREGTAIYNTAVLIDRAGNVEGKYRKVYLPREEVEAGLMPGSDYPVFRTDFGTVGLMICYDVFFADPARALATKTS